MDKWLNRCAIGDCREVLRRMADDGVRVQCVVTSPPYWGLRDYGTGGWEGGDGSECGHEKDRTTGIASSTLGGGKATTNHQREASYPHTCAKCGARRVDKQLGLESTIHEYVENMVEVFRLVREVLADDGTLWLNLGDSYANNGLKDSSKVGGLTGDRIRAGNKGVMGSQPRSIPPGLKPKDLCGIPWRVAFALQADGWYLRSDIIWHKPNPMPESCTDRPTKAHEYIFLLTKAPRYFYDADAVREEEKIPGKSAKQIASVVARRTGLLRKPKEVNDVLGTWRGDGTSYKGGRNRRTVWTIPSQPFADAHFATFPKKLVEPCVMAGTSERGHCPECGARWERVTESEQISRRPNSDSKRGDNPSSNRSVGGPQRGSMAVKRTTLGFRPACTHDLDPVPDVVLDPFLGSGTAAEVAQHLGRTWIGIDLNSDYSKMQERRTAQGTLAL